MTSRFESLTSSRLLAGNVLLNVVGWGVPAVAALAAMPALIHGLGDERFGVLALAWTVLGYFSLFDLGIGRALTYSISERLGSGRQEEIPEVVWTSLALLAPIGIAGSIVMFLLAPWLAQSALRVPVELQGEATTSFMLLALAIPFTSTTAALRGTLEAEQRFGLVNALRVPYGLLTFLGPLAALPFSHSVVPAIAILTVGRAILCAAHFVACYRVIPGFSTVQGRRSHIRGLLTFGGWMTVSNIVSPLMNTFDRFVVGSVVALGAVTYYATPHEVVTKMWLFTAAVHPVFFPAIATSAVREPARAAMLFDRTLRATLAALFVPTLLLVAFAPEIFTIWLGPEFATRSAVILQILAPAIFVNCIAQGALIFIHALGRPDLTGKYHLAELPLYALLLAVLLPRWGLPGVAWAWAIRATVDAALLIGTCPRLLDASRAGIKRVSLWLVALVPLMIAVALLPTLATRVLAVAILIPAWVAIVWWRILTPAERLAPARLRMAPTGGERS